MMTVSKKRGLMLLAATILLPLALTACGPKRIERIPVPANLKTCEAEPEAPALPTVDWSSVDTAKPIQFVRDQLTLTYVLALVATGGDCRAKVNAIAEWDR
jgi:hypothetical protein